MPSETLVRVTYWAGWICAVGAILYKFLYAAGVMLPIGVYTRVFPYHVWQGAFLFFLICIATEGLLRRRA